MQDNSLSNSLIPLACYLLFWLNSLNFWATLDSSNKWSYDLHGQWYRSCIMSKICFETTYQVFKCAESIFFPQPRVWLVRLASHNLMVLWNSYVHGYKRHSPCMCTYSFGLEIEKRKLLLITVNSLSFDTTNVRSRVDSDFIRGMSDSNMLIPGKHIQLFDTIGRGNGL